MTESLVALGFETDRLKTGTPARVDARTVNFDVLEKQPGDEEVRWFSFDPTVTLLLYCSAILLQAAALKIGCAHQAQGSIIFDQCCILGI